MGSLTSFSPLLPSKAEVGLGAVVKPPPWLHRTPARVCLVGTCHASAPPLPAQGEEGGSACQGFLPHSSLEWRVGCVGMPQPWARKLRQARRPAQDPCLRVLTPGQGLAMLAATAGNKERQKPSRGCSPCQIPAEVPQRHGRGFKPPASAFEPPAGGHAPVGGWGMATAPNSLLSREWGHPQTDPGCGTVQPGRGFKPPPSVP